MLGLEGSYRRQRRVTDAYRHNPYVGAMQYHSRGLQRERRQLLPDTERRNAYVGTFRHAPESQGLKDILWEDDHWRTPVVSQLQLARQSVLAKHHLGLTALRMLPVGLFSAAEGAEASDRPMCVICLEEFNDGDELRHLACGHCFHRSCIDLWLLGTLADDETNTNSCPICKQCAHPNASGGSAVADSASDADEEASIPAEVFRMVGEALHSRDTQYEQGSQLHQQQQQQQQQQRAVVPVVTAVVPGRHPPQPSSTSSTASTSAMFAPLLARLLPMQEVWQQ